MVSSTMAMYTLSPSLNSMLPTWMDLLTDSVLSQDQKFMVEGLY